MMKTHLPPPPPPLDTVPHLVESILTLAIRSVPRPILFASAARFASYLNVLDHDSIIGVSLAAIHRMPWIDSTLAARLGDIWLLRQLGKLADLPTSSRLRRPLQFHPQSIALSVGKLGNLELIQYLAQNSPNFLQGCVDHVVYQASHHGHVHVLDWVAQHEPHTFLTIYTANHLAHLLPGDTSGERHIRTLQWWIAHPNLWHPRWLKQRHMWHLQALVHACKLRNMRVVEHWLAAQDYGLIHSNPDRRRQYLSWPLAAAAFTGDLAFFDSIHALWPESMAPRVVALACASGNLALAKHCHALLVASAADLAGHVEFGKQDADLCYLLATAAAGYTRNAQVAVAILNWLHDDLQLAVSGQADGAGIAQLRWITGDAPDWPISWDRPFYLTMHVASATGFPALLDWWHVHAQRSITKHFFRNPLQEPVGAAAALQWWKDSGLIDDVFHDKHTLRTLVVPMWIERGASVELFDWLLRYCDMPAGTCDPIQSRFPILMLDRACLAGRIDLLHWIRCNLSKLPAPVYSAGAFDLAFRGGHLLALQWLKDEGFLDALRAQAAETGVPLEQAIPFIAKKWPECFECFEWALANGFDMYEAMRKRAVEQSMHSPLYVESLQRHVIE